MIEEIPVFPQYVLSSGQGKIGTRKWLLDDPDDVDGFVSSVCGSHWPNDENALPVSIQVGAFDEKIYSKPGSDGGSDDVGSGEFAADMGALPRYGKTLVIAQYQLLHVENQWPTTIPKPLHMARTTLTLKVRGSGEACIIWAGAMKVGATAPYTQAHNPNIMSGVQVSATPTDARCRIIIPHCEYHITCDRLTKEQVDQIMAVKRWQNREGTVNNDWYLGEPPDCLLFDAWEMDHSFAPSTVDPFRFRLTAVLRSRKIPNPAYGQGGSNDVQYGFLGWNYDYDNKGGWKPIIIKAAQNSNQRTWRYPPDDFTYIFLPGGGSGGS